MISSKSVTSSFLALLFILFSGAFTPISNMAATAWEIDKVHSKISFEVTHFFTPVSGQFTDYNSDINFDPDNLGESSVDVEIQVSSIDTDNQKRDGHLQSGDFFNAAEYPTITFSSNEIVKKSGQNEFAAIGTLTIKDVSRKIELPFTLLGIRDHPMQENTQLAGIKFTHSINRNDYDVGTGDWVATAVVGGEVDITGTLELNSSSS
ncbi:YceI family protein [Halalkalibaculum sp. DA3122]|uniref:YceI family protein n=1 Tax=Halalkalibaculum sp. DA3122 TaxID=3373607 RepID=UPI003754F81F